MNVFLMWIFVKMYRIELSDKLSWIRQAKVERDNFNKPHANHNNSI